jgi:hypothetical protein
MRVYKTHHSETDRSTLKIKRREEGKGPLHTEATYRAEIMNRAKSK